MATSAPAAGGGDSHILREYLVALGFRINERRQRNFNNTLIGLDKRAVTLGRSLLGAGAAAVTLATVFTRSMERLFYNARYADTTVSKLQALEFAGRNVGLAGGEMTQGLKSMAAAMRGNPGLTALMDRLTGGSISKGKTMDRVMLDFVRATKSMPPFVAQQIAEMFGIGPEMLFNMQQGLDKMEEAAKLREQMAKDMGVDADDLAKSSVELANTWRGLTEQATVFGLTLMRDAMPAIRVISGTLEQMMYNWSDFTDKVSRDPWMEKIFKGVDRITGELETGTWSGHGKRMVEGIVGQPGGERVQLSDEAQRRYGTTQYEHGRLDWFGIPRLVESWEKWRNMKDRRRKGLPTVPEAGAYDIREDDRDFKHGGTRDAGDTSPGGVDHPSSYLYDDDDTAPGGRDEPEFDPQAHLRMLERKYKLPQGILDRVWRRESQRGDPKWMRSPAGAMGHFGFMPDTAKAYGLKDPDDFMESSSASARMWADLLKQFGGDVSKAAAAYNWGSGNVQKYGMGAMPGQTRDYVKDVAQPQGNVNVNTEINIHGVSDPGQAAELTRRKQSDVAGDVVRNMAPRVR